MAKRKKTDLTSQSEGLSKRSKTEQQPALIPMARTENPPKASLLGLPAELRNRVYDYAIGSGEVITLRAPCGEEPALLRCSSQVRREARAMWLQTAHFKLLVRNAKFEPHVGHWFWRNYEASRTEVHCEGQPYLENLCGWVRQLHAGVAPEWSTVRVDDEWKDENKHCLRVLAVMRVMDDLRGVEVEHTIGRLT